MSNDSKNKPECQTTKTFTVYVIQCKVTNMNYARKSIGTTRREESRQSRRSRDAVILK